MLDIVRSTSNILKLIYKDLAQPSVQTVGKAIGTVLEFSTLPFKYVQLQNDKFNLNMKKRLDEYKTKLEQIPEDKVVEVHTQIGVPILEKLSYTTNDEIADLFTTLLASASNVDMMHTAHPSFVSMIDRLSVDEARILKFLKGKDSIDYCDFQGYKPNSNGFFVIKKHLTLIPHFVNLDYPSNIGAYLDNMVCLGILIDANGRWHINQDNYKRIEELNFLDQYRQKNVPSVYESISVENGYYEITDFGKLFIKACVKD